MSVLAAATTASWALVVGSAHAIRGRLYATFAGVVLGIHALSIVGLGSSAVGIVPALLGLQAVTTIHFLSLLRPRMRGLLHRALVSWPSSMFVAGSWLAIPWSLAAAFGVETRYALVPFGLAATGLVQSLTAREETVDLVLGEGSPTERLRRHPRGSTRTERPLRIVQITDTHLGPFMSIDALARICARAVEREPDLILLTGDYLTMESQSDASYLTRALEPLRAMRGRVFACLGNHDHEAPRVVRDALAANGIVLLVDAEARVDTPAGPVQLVGADFVWRNRREHLVALAARIPRIEGSLRLWLVHHPGGFADLPEGEADLVLSGHTHGGHLGLVSLGIPTTFVSAVTDIPDHGFWSRGRDRLYVHRGTCHYGFPIRLGVPAERSLLCVHRPAS